MSLHADKKKVVSISKTKQINLDDLEVKELQRRLDLLLKELDVCKAKCEKYKLENIEYRNGIEALSKDNREYMTYLQTKKAEKLDAIQQLSAVCKSDMEKFNRMKQDLQTKHDKEIKLIMAQISELDQKLLDKQRDFSSLQEIVEKRAKHNAEVAVIKAEMEKSTLAFQNKIAAIEDELLKERMALQLESVRKIEDMKLHANEKAAEFLAEHCKMIKDENLELEKQLAELSINTAKLTEKREKLKQVVSELERERRIKAGVMMARMKKIDEAEKKISREKSEKKAENIRKNLEIAKKMMQKCGMDEVKLLANTTQFLTDSDSSDID